MKKYTIRVPEEDWVEWQKAAVRQRCDVSDVVRRAVNAEISKHQHQKNRPLENRIEALERGLEDIRHLLEDRTQ